MKACLVSSEVAPRFIFEAATESVAPSPAPMRAAENEPFEKKPYTAPAIDAGMAPQSADFQ